MKIKPLLIVILLCTLLLCIYLPRVHAESLRCGDSDVLCGPLSLLVICQSLKIEADLNELASLSGFDEKKGATMLGLKKAAEAKGLCAVGMKISLDDLVSSEAAAIAHLWSNHFVVVEEDGPDTLKVTSPAGEARIVSKQDFAKSYSGFALLVAQDESLFPKAEANGPDLRFERYDFDFGFIEEGEQVGYTFAYRNKGNEELVLSKADTSCSCTEAFLLEEKRVPPGGTGELVVGFDGTGRQGGQFHTVYVHSNDPISPIVQLRISGVIKPIRLPVSVRSLHFGTAKKREGATREFSIRDLGDGSLTVNDVTSDSPFVDVSLTKNTDEQRPGYVIKAVLKSGAPIGELKSTIKVSTNHPREPVVEIPVAADVIGDIEVFPNQFFLGLLKKGQSVSKTIALSMTSEEPLTIGKIDSPFDYIKVKSQAETDGRKYSITATLKNTAPLGLIKGEVVIHTNNADQPEIKVPLYALVEE